MLLTRSPLYSPPCGEFRVRLACVRRAASVRPEPGSNSPNKDFGIRSETQLHWITHYLVVKHQGCLGDSPPRKQTDIILGDGEVSTAFQYFFGGFSDLPNEQLRVKDSRSIEPPRSLRLKNSDTRRSRFHPGPIERKSMVAIAQPEGQ